MKSSNFEPMEMSAIELEATALNCDVIVAKDNELQFDLDTEEDQQLFRTFFYSKLVPTYGGDIEVTEWASKSNNCHMVVKLPVSLTIPVRIALQAMGGSDPGREFAALRCWKAGSPHPILLFKPKNKGLLGNGEVTA